MTTLMLFMRSLNRLPATLANIRQKNVLRERFYEKNI